MESLGSLCNYHSLEDGPDSTIGGNCKYGEWVREYGMFHDDPNDMEMYHDRIGSSAIILIMSICIPNKFKE